MASGITQWATPSAMINMQRPKQPRKFVKGPGAALVALVAWTVAAQAADCPRKEALGTSRVLGVDAAATPRVGLKSFPQTLPLRDHEVVLTFDDGPWPPTTQRVLVALAHECVRATFFLVGKPASEHPGLVRRIAAEGHTIGHHTWLHPSLMRIPPDEATEEIDHGIAAFGADLWAGDWKPMTPKQELKVLIDRLNRARKGIILLHDPKAQTAAMLPHFLRYLHDNDYRVVHVVPAASGPDTDRLP